MPNYFYNAICGKALSKYDFRDKFNAINNHARYMFSRTQQMFRYFGLPDTIPARMLELYLQFNGFVGIYKHEGKLYAYFGGLGGEPDEYYRPTILTISNPAQNFSVNAKIGKDCVIIKNDSLYIGLRPMFERYATSLAENELSLFVTQVNSRITSLISANDDRTKVSAEKFLKDVEDGKLGVIGSSEFFEGLKTAPYATAATNALMQNLIEYEQYLKASWYNELGLNANYNMKRETLTSSENEMNHDALLPLVDDMLQCRREGLEEVNKMFGTNITVELASAWEDNQKELDVMQKIAEQEGGADGETETTE